MSAQTTYKFSTLRGAAGGIMDLAPYQIDSFINEENDGVMKFGCAVIAGTTAGKQVKLSASGGAFEGITVNGRTSERGLDGAISIKKGETIGVMRYGKIFGALAANVTPSYNDPVYAVLSGDDKGCFTTSNSGTMAINARFVGGADNGVAPIELLNKNVVDATGEAYTLPNASASTLGGIKVGTGLQISDAGVLSVTE